MASAGHGRLDILTELINMEAKINIQAKNGWTAIDFARKQNQLEASHYLQEELGKEENIFRENDYHEKQEILEKYHLRFNDDLIDYKLLVKLIWHVHSNTDTREAILGKAKKIVKFNKSISRIFFNIFLFSLKI